MSEPFSNSGDKVFLKLANPEECGPIAHAAVITPSPHQLCINGAPVTEEAHELVLKSVPGRGVRSRRGNSDGNPA